MQTTISKSRAKIAPIRILLDSGATKSIVFHEIAQKLRLKRDKRTVWTTLAGQFETSLRTQVIFKLNEFDEDITIKHEMTVCKQKSNYDMIIGVDLLMKLGIVLDFSNLEMIWGERKVPMKSRNATFATSFTVTDSEPVSEATARIKRILEAKYEPADLDKVAAANSELSDEEQKSLKRLLVQYQSLFDGTVGEWKGEEYNIELKPGVQPYHARAYPIPRAYEQTLRLEVERLERANIIRKINRSEWTAPTFIIPKKDKTVRFISDFRELNKRIKRKPFPIPKIQDLLLKLEGFRYGTSLDLNMGYYHIVLSPHSRRLCTIVLPWGSTNINDSQWDSVTVQIFFKKKCLH